MSKFDQPNYFMRLRRKRVRGPLEARLFALRRGVGSKVGRNVTEPMLARLLGCTVSHYQRMERGRHPFKDSHLRKLAEYYGEGFEELAQLREMERLLIRAGFPGRDPRPLLRSALEYAEGLLPDWNTSIKPFSTEQVLDIWLIGRASGACSVFLKTIVKGSLIPATQITMCFSGRRVPHGGRRKQRKRVIYISPIYTGIASEAVLMLIL